MSIIYSLVSRSYDVVLSEHTEFAGNFQQITRLLMRRMLRNGCSFINYDKYKFYYLFENNIAYLALSDNTVRDELVFAFLKEVQKTFLSNYSLAEINEFHAYQLTDFNQVLESLIHHYNTNPKTSRGGEQIGDTVELRDIHIDNIERLFDRDEKMNLVAMRNDDLRGRTFNIHYHAATAKREKSKYTKLFIIGAIVVVIVIVLVFGRKK